MSFPGINGFCGPTATVGAFGGSYLGGVKRAFIANGVFEGSGFDCGGGEERIFC